MNDTHIHLLINHLPVFGSVTGGLLLLYGLFRLSTHTQIAAYCILIISSLAACFVYITGEEAADTVENIQGIAKDMIAQHEDAAFTALVSLIVLGIAAVASLVFTIKESSFMRRAAISTGCIALISFALVARTGYLGGLIRHSELHLTNEYPVMNGDKEREQKDITRETHTYLP